MYNVNFPSLIYIYILEQQSTTLFLVFVLLCRRKKTPVTVETFVRILVSVKYNLVNLHSVPPGEQFSADIATERSLSGMYTLVLLQVVIQTETFSALIAMEWLLSVVDSTPVVFQTHILGEIFTTLVAME